MMVLDLILCMWYVDACMEVRLDSFRVGSAE